MSDPIDEFAARQRAYFRTGATRPLKIRLESLTKLADAIEGYERQLTDALGLDLRKSPEQAFSSEIGLVLNEIRHAKRHLRSWTKPTRRRVPPFAWPASGRVHREPYGVALVIGAWNYPVQLLLMPLVSAMAAGNCVILKPSEIAPHTSAAIDAMIRATFPPEYVAVVEGGPEAVTQLIACKLDMIFFTGSRRAGISVMAAAAVHPTPVVLELGGKCPCVVCADAPLEITARRIVWGKFLNAGQTCVAPDYVLVDRNIQGVFLDALKRAIVEFYGEDPSRSADYGRIINRFHFDRLLKYLEFGQLVHGGGRNVEDLFLEPTVIADIPPHAPVLHEEIFGPVLPICAFGDLGEAVSMIANRPTPLASYLFSKDRSIQSRFLAETRSGGVCFNDVVSHMVGTGLPFGGLGASGFGAYHGEAGFECFSHRRAVLNRWFKPDLNLRYPPPKVSLKTMKRAFRYLMGG